MQIFRAEHLGAGWRGGVRRQGEPVKKPWGMFTEQQGGQCGQKERARRRMERRAARAVTWARSDKAFVRALALTLNRMRNWTEWTTLGLEHDVITQGTGLKTPPLGAKQEQGDWWGQDSGSLDHCGGSGGVRGACTLGRFCLLRRTNRMCTEDLGTGGRRKGSELVVKCLGIWWACWHCAGCLILATAGVSAWKLAKATKPGAAPHPTC